jgi:DNA topoisomerase IB
MNPATRMFVDDETFDEWLPDSVETKMRHVRTPSAWPGNPPVGTPLPLPNGESLKSRARHLLDDMPDAPKKVPAGHVRLWHFTKDDDTSESIAAHGILVDKNTYGGVGGEPTGVWLSTKRPEDSNKPVVEVVMPISELSSAADNPKYLDPDEYGNSAEYGHYVAQGDVPAENIVNIHRKWQWWVQRAMENQNTIDNVLSGKFDDQLDKPNLDYDQLALKRAIAWIKENHGKSDKPKSLFDILVSEDKMRHVRDPSAWPGNPPVGTPLPLGPEWSNAKPARSVAKKPATRRPSTRTAAPKKRVAAPAKPKRDIYKDMHPATRKEREMLKVPPAWTDVYVANDLEKAATLAKGRAANGKLQQIQAPWAKVAAANEKYARNKELTKLIEQLDAALKRDSMVDMNAAVVLLARITGMRNGSKDNKLSDKQIAINKEQMRQAIADGTYNKETFKPKEYVAYGATNIEARHVTINKDSVRFQFIGKKRVPIDITFKDPELVKVMAKWKNGKTGRERIFPGTNPNSNVKYIRTALGHDKMKMHDLRTFKAATIALQAIKVFNGKKPESPKEFIQWRNEVATKVSKVLGNDRNEAIKSYIDPVIFDQWRNPEWGEIKGDVVHAI